MSKGRTEAKDSKCTDYMKYDGDREEKQSTELGKIIKTNFLKGEKLDRYITKTYTSNGILMVSVQAIKHI